MAYRSVSSQYSFDMEQKEADRIRTAARQRVLVHANRDWTKKPCTSAGLGVRKSAIGQTVMMTTHKDTPAPWMYLEDS